MAQAKKKKRFYDVEIPIIGKTTHLQAFEIPELKDKVIRYDLTRSLRGKSILLDLKVVVDREKATSYPIEAKILPYYLRRAVRKGTDYVEDSFRTTCKNAEITIKPLLVTRRKVSREVRKALRETAKKELIEYVKDKNSDVLFDELLNNSIQKPLSLKLKKIYPLSLCEIRIFKIEKEFEPEAKIKKEKSKELEEKPKEIQPEETKE